MPVLSAPVQMVKQATFENDMVSKFNMINPLFNLIVEKKQDELFSKRNNKRSCVFATALESHNKKLPSHFGGPTLVLAFNSGIGKHLHV